MNRAQPEPSSRSPQSPPPFDWGSITALRGIITGSKPSIVRLIHLIKVTGLSGAENHLLTLLSGLQARGHETRLLLLVEPGRPAEEVVAAAQVRGIPTERVPIYADFDPTLLVRLTRRLRAFRPDVAHTHLLHADLHGIPAARLAGVPVVITSRHNDDAFRVRPGIRQVNRWLWGRVDAGIAISEAVARFTVDVEDAPPDRLVTIHYGLPPASPVGRETSRADLRAALGLPAETLLAGTVCRLVEQKGLPYGLEAFARIAGRFPAAHLVLTGDGPLRGALEAQAAALGVAERTHFLGWRAETAPIFAGLDLFLMPSLWEGFGLVLLEAMAQGVPVVGSAVSAIPEVVVDGETGLLVPPRDVAGLAEALAALLGDPARRAAMGAAGRARLETHFTPSRMVDETLALYERLNKKA